MPFLQAVFAYTTQQEQHLYASPHYSFPQSIRASQSPLPSLPYSDRPPYWPCTAHFKKNKLRRVKELKPLARSEPTRRALDELGPCCEGHLRMASSERSCFTAGKGEWSVPGRASRRVWPAN